MRSYLSFAIILLVALLPYRAQAQCGIFYDGFESGNYTPTWGSAGGTYNPAVITTNPAVGNNCLHLSGSGSHLSGLTATFPSSQPTSVSWRIRYDPSTSAGGYFVIGDASMSANNCIAFCYISGGANIRFYNTSGLNTPCSASTWYQIELRNIDYVNRRFDIYINNSLIQSNYAFRSSTINSMDRIYLYNLGGINSYYDEIIVGGNPVSLTPSGVDPNCAGDSSGTATITATGGVPQYSYQWSTGGTTGTISNLPAGTYTVTVTDSVGCTVSDTVQLTAPPALSDSLSSISPACNGDSTGSVDLTPGGGTPGYTYMWSNGATTQDLSNVPAGNYVVTISDSLGCSLMDSVTLFQPSPVQDSLAIEDPLCNGDSTGSILITSIGGSPGYSYLWNTGDTTGNLGNLWAGTYIVTVTDAAGCMHVDSVTVTQPTAMTSTGTVTDEVTPPGANGAIDLTPGGGTPGYTFLWSNGATTEDLTGLTAGTFSVQITDNNGCVTSDTFMISLIVGLAEAISPLELKAFPNPGNGSFTLHIQPEQQVSVWLSISDLSGKEIRRQKLDLVPGENEVGLDLRNEAAGIYLLRLEGENMLQNLKLIKQD